MVLSLIHTTTRRDIDMIDFSKYTDLEQTVILGNGKEASLFSKMTKKGLRYFYWSFSNGRLMPISKTNAGIS